MPAEARDRQQQMERAAQLVEAPEIPAHERLALVVREIGVGERLRWIGLELFAELAILLQAIQEDVDVVAAHASDVTPAIPRPPGPRVPSRRRTGRAPGPARRRRRARSSSGARAIRSRGAPSS